MKRTGFALIALVILAFLFAQCKKKDDNRLWNAGFYSSWAQGKMFLYINDAYQGELPYFAAPPTCEQRFSETLSPRYEQLQSGQYKITGKDSSGRVMSESWVTIREGSLGTEGGTGGARVDQNGDCVMIGLFR